jgi:hypothetical protein
MSLVGTAFEDRFRRDASDASSAGRSEMYPPPVRVTITNAVTQEATAGSPARRAGNRDVGVRRLEDLTSSRTLDQVDPERRLDVGVDR